MTAISNMVSRPPFTSPRGFTLSWWTRGKLRRAAWTRFPYGRTLISAPCGSAWTLSGPGITMTRPEQPWYLCRKGLLYSHPCMTGTGGVWIDTFGKPCSSGSRAKKRQPISRSIPFTFLMVSPGQGQTSGFQSWTGKSLKPLHTRLDWLNDNLTVTHAIGIEELISKMARGVTWQELYQEIIENAEKIQEDFEATAAASSQQMANAIHEMTESLTEEINRVVEKTFQMSLEVKKLDKELREWETVCTGMRAFLDEVDKSQKNTIQQTVKTQNEFYNMVRQIDYEIATSRRNREKIEKKISKEIIKLKESYRKLREKLFSFKLW